MSLFFKVCFLFFVPISGWATGPSFYACKSLAEYAAIRAVGHSEDILSARATVYRDQNLFDLEKGEIRVRIFVEEDQAGYYIFSATLKHTPKYSKVSGASSLCELTDLIEGR